MRSPVGEGRERLLQALFDEFGETGPSPKLSMRQVAERLGVHHTLLTYHFGSRPGLLSAVLSEARRRDNLVIAAMGKDLGFAALCRAIWSFYSNAEHEDRSRTFFSPGRTCGLRAQSISRFRRRPRRFGAPPRSGGPSRRIHSGGCKAAEHHRNRMSARTVAAEVAHPRRRGRRGSRALHHLVDSVHHVNPSYTTDHPRSRSPARGRFPWARACFGVRRFPEPRLNDGRSPFRHLYERNAERCDK